MCLTPLVSYTRNIGFGHSSTNTKKDLKQINKLNNSKIKYSVNIFGSMETIPIRLHIIK